MYVLAFPKPMYISAHACSYKHRFRKVLSATLIFLQYLTEDSPRPLSFVGCIP